jgi:hypothetical protein
MPGMILIGLGVGDIPDITRIITDITVPVITTRLIGEEDTITTVRIPITATEEELILRDEALIQTRHVLREVEEIITVPQADQADIRPEQVRQDQHPAEQEQPRVLEAVEAENTRMTHQAEELFIMTAELHPLKAE